MTTDATDNERHKPRLRGPTALSPPNAAKCDLCAPSPDLGEGLERLAARAEEWG